MNKDIFYRILISVMLISLLLMSFHTCRVQKEAIDETTELKKSILASDKLIKESAGQYSKLVDYYKTEKDLVNDLKRSNSELYKTIKNQGERLLSISSAIVSLDKKVVEGFGQVDPEDTNKLNLSLKYPNEKDPFVFWDGWINKHTAAYKGTFSFGKLPIKVVLTEEKRGLWKSRIIGPEWLNVDSMSVISIPPEDYIPVEVKKIQWLVGGSYYHGLNSIGNGIGVNFGVNIFDRHNIIFGANSLQQVSVGYTFKIKTFKKK
jgi:hypothetical protein